MSTFHLVNVWAEPEGPVAFNPMPHSLLWMPDSHLIGQPRPAFIFLHAWGGYPHDDLALNLGPALADRGFGFLSLCLRRRGGEGQLTALPDNDLRDIKLAVDYLSANGFADIYLVGEEIGAWSALAYQVHHRDSRVKAAALIDPLEDAAVYLRNKLGAEQYDATLREAAVAARQGAGMDYRIDRFPEDAAGITMQAAPFLAWWGPQAKTRISDAYAATRMPLLLFAEAADSLPEALRKDRPAAETARHYGDRAQLLDLFSEGAWHLGGDPLENSRLEIAGIDVRDRSLYGFYWQPAEPTDTAVLLMHGLTSSPTSTLFQKMAPVLSQEVAVLAIESHRSGWSGHETALLNDELGDFDGWLSWLRERGIKRIVLAGASMGSASIGRYYSVQQPGDVAGLAHLMPTADCPEWFRDAAGVARYEQVVAEAVAAVDAGQGGEHLIDVDVRQPPPSLSHGRFRWTQRAASWLSWWGPDADSRNSVHIANADVPVLLLSGTTDSYNDEARFAELKEAAVKAPSVTEIWYEDIDHGLNGVETKVAEDLLNWMRDINVI